ncbi:MAG: Fe2+-dependent dioxygenase [Sphingomonas fennica]
MMLAVPGVLGADRVAALRASLDAADWVDGNLTSGPQAALAKRNRQLPEHLPEAQAAANEILDALGRTPLFIAAALPLKVLPPLFNRYDAADGGRFGLHVDNAVRFVPRSDVRIRTDLSATLFLADPADYDGGELVVEDLFGTHAVKLAAGDLVLYPASSLHRVTPVTRGVRVAAFFWVQSMIRDDADRRTLLELDRAVQALAVDRGQDDAEVVRLTGIYHNLLRRWAEI